MSLPLRAPREGYQELPTTSGGKPKEEPFNFKWMKHEVTVIAVLELCWVVYLFYDFAKVNRQVVQEEKIVGVTEGFFGIPRDTNDAQWNAWRNSLHILIGVAIVHLGIGAIIKKAKAASPDKTAILLFNILMGIVFILYLERSGIIYWFLFTGVFFTLIKFTHQWRIFPLLLWGASLLTLYMNEMHHGYGFEFISESLHTSMLHAPVRWNVIFNMTILRMISFGMDLYWAEQQKPLGKSYETLSYRQRQDTHQPIKVYNILTYYAYLAYIPLFLTGPIITFNAWISQIYIPQKEYSNKDIVKYGLRLAFVFLCFEVFLHVYYINAIATRSENIHIWQKYFQKTQHILMMSLLELFFLWFKFLILWRFARLWSLIHGVESPENMNRCVANNYCFEGFWRSWHRSFNQWLIRYIFIPLGGSKYKFYNIWAVFSFVAIWHDMNWNLLLWSWLICLSLMPEMFVKFYFHQRKMRPLWDKIWFRYAAAGLCTIVVLSMMVANLIGYGTGKDTLLMIFKRVGNNEEIVTIVGAALLVFLNNNWLFKIREVENAKGQGANF